MLHADFRAIDDKTEITAHLPVELKGESAGVKAGGVLEQVLHSIEIHCLPKDLPEQIVVDVSALEIGEGIQIADVELPEGVAATQSGELVIAHVARARVDLPEPGEEGEELEGAAEEEPTEPEVLGEKKDEEQD
jgi:large subunit ribosomal protein L25